MRLDLFSRWIDESLFVDQRQDPEFRFRAEIALALGVLQFVAFSSLSIMEFLWGTPQIGLLFLIALLPLGLSVWWLRRGGKLSPAINALLLTLYVLAALINIGTGGAAVGVNIALPTFVLFAVLLSSTRAALIWTALTMAQIIGVTLLRGSGFEAPIKTNADWAASAAARVPLVFGLATAVVGLLIRLAMKRYRLFLDDARKAEQVARKRADEQALQFSEFARIAADEFWETDAELKLKFVSPSFSRRIGLPIEALLGMTLQQAYGSHFPGLGAVGGIMQPMQQREEKFHTLLKVLDEEGQWQWLRVEAFQKKDANGKFVGYLGVVREITTQHEAQEALRQSEQRLRLITDSLPALISYIDAAGIFRFNNRTYSEWLSRPLEEVTGRAVSDVFSASTYAVIAPNLAKALAGKRVDFDIEPGDSRDRHVQVAYVPDFDDLGSVRGVYGLIHDVTQMRAVQSELRKLSEFDLLTGLANRRRLNNCLEVAIAGSERSGLSMAIIFLDLDHFKTVNDTLGHKGGDLVLQEFARRLQRCVRATDTVARQSGDEFVILLEGLQTIDDAARVADQILLAMAEPFEIMQQHRILSTSMGIVFRCDGDRDAESLLRRADEALYAAKAAGRGRYHVALMAPI